MLFLSQESFAADDEAQGTKYAPLPSAASSTSLTSSNNVKEDEIDIFLSKQDGLIHRNRDPQL